MRRSTPTEPEQRRKGKLEHSGGRRSSRDGKERKGEPLAMMKTKKWQRVRGKNKGTFSFHYFGPIDLTEMIIIVRQYSKGKSTSLTRSPRRCCSWVVGAWRLLSMPVTQAAWCIFASPRLQYCTHTLTMSLINEIVDVSPGQEIT